MPRLKLRETKRLEELEGALGCLASAHVHLDTIRMRVENASGFHPGILGPALEEAERIDQLIRKAQVIISVHAPTPARHMNE
jgi:hypothetical protein